ncbi:hypothetical protein [Phenylobacterium sp.]|uniref:hypothetical protein n=1 Tax=Phenylobacterium sp. TaxID=1871053 RepID=UPI002DE4AA44|nr:hypothetical protein [Phenylobacterium sp.]
MAEFEMTACHANRAGQASVTLRHVPTGAMVMIHHVPFQHDYAETVRDECQRIRETAAKIGEAAMSFLTSHTDEAEVLPDQQAGAAPQPGEPAKPFDQTA